MAFVEKILHDKACVLTFNYDCLLDACLSSEDWFVACFFWIWCSSPPCESLLPWSASPSKAALSRVLAEAARVGQLGSR